MDRVKLEKRIKQMYRIIEDMQEGTSPFTYTGEQLHKLTDLLNTIESEQGEDE